MPANHVLLQRTTLTADTATVTLSGIPTTGYTDLKLVMSARTTYAGAQSDYVIVKFNNTTTTYTGRLLIGTGTSVSSISPNGWRWFAEVNSNGQTAKTFGNAEIYIPNYSVVGVTKPYSSNSVSESNAATTEMEIFSGLWSGTDAINSIEMASGNSGNFMAGSSFSLYGIANAVTTPVTSPKADGGDIIKTDGTYWYHAFTGSGVFKPQLNLTCDYLIVAGGGGGGTSGGYEVPGGGGAGGLRYFSAQSLNGSVPYIVSVGAGGARDTNGQDSAFNGATSTGGGKGGAYVPPGGSGGSGGGAVGWGNRLLIGYGNTPATSPSQGNNGGEGSYQWSESGGGGGGGAGAVGGNAGYNSSGNGGIGSSTYSSWGSITGTGHNVSGTYYYAGGGGGSYGYNGHAGGTGGYGGGGSGSGPNGGSGLYATGGGGAGGMSSSGGVAGAGGSGIVIIRYPVA